MEARGLHESSGFRVFIFDLPSCLAVKSKGGNRLAPISPFASKGLLLLRGLLLSSLFLGLFLGSHGSISCEGVDCPGDPPVDRWVSEPLSRGPDYTASERLVKLKSRTLIDGITIAPPCSVPARRSAFPSASKLLSMNNGDSLNLKF